MKRGLFIIPALFTALCAQANTTTFTRYGSVLGNPYVNGTTLQGYEYIANRSCKDMSCVQQNIQLIDSQIADLIARRLAFVKRGAALKSSATVSAGVQHDPNVIPQVVRQAQAQGYPPEIAQSVFTEIDKQSQAYEDKYEGMAPQPSPNSLGVPTHNVTNPVLTPSINGPQ